MQNNREALAWTVLLFSIAVFVALAVSGPLAVRWYLFNADVEQVASLDVTTGIPLVTEPGRELPTGITSRLEPVAEGSRLETDAVSQANLTLADPDGQAVLATLQIYGGTGVELASIRSPRFSLSPKPHVILLSMTRGRMRAQLSLDVPRPVTLTIRTPQGQVTLDEPGAASVEVSNAEMTVVVRDGRATVSGQGDGLVVLQTDQRTVVPLDGVPQGVLAAERNLIVNGDFQDVLADNWQVLGARERETEPSGRATVETLEGRGVARFSRSASGLHWALVGMRQELNRDIRDYRSLRLHLLVQVVSQDLFNCGAYGTECPVMVKVIYRDENDDEQEWLQGFYSELNHNDGVPVICVTCPPPKVESHLSIPPLTWVSYDSPNLIEVFAQAGLEPATITAIEIYASGHAFESLVTEVELLAQE